MRYKKRALIARRNKILPYSIVSPLSRYARWPDKIRLLLTGQTGNQLTGLTGDGQTGQPAELNV
jgi:hypothetical protein